jgi:hypothetical protein
MSTLQLVPLPLQLLPLPVGKYKLAKDWSIYPSWYDINIFKQAGLKTEHRVLKDGLNHELIIFPAGLIIRIIKYSRDGVQIGIFPSHNKGADIPKFSIIIPLYLELKKFDYELLPVVEVP